MFLPFVQELPRLEAYPVKLSGSPAHVVCHSVTCISEEIEAP